MPDFSLPTLTALACADPVAAAADVLVGDPAVVEATARGFREAATTAGNVATAGQDADRMTALAYRNDGQAVYDAAAERPTSRTLLADDGHTMTVVADLLTGVAAGLTDAQQAAKQQLAMLDEEIAAVVAARNRQVAGQRFAPEDLAAIDRGYQLQAAERVRERHARIVEIVEAYDQLLASRTGHLQEFGYTAAPERGAAPKGFTAADVAAGAADAVTDTVTETGEMLADLNPLRALTDPAGYGDTLARYAGGVAALPGAIIRDPTGIADQMMFGGELANAEWDKATGQLLGGMAIGGAAKILNRMKLPIRVAAQARAEVVLSRLPQLNEQHRDVLEETIYRATVNRPRFPGHDGEPFENDGRNGTARLPAASTSYYQEWTIQANGKDRLDGRLVIGGPPDNPDVIYFSDDHYRNFTKVYP